MTDCPEHLLIPAEVSPFGVDVATACTLQVDAHETVMGLPMHVGDNGWRWSG